MSTAARGKYDATAVVPWLNSLIINGYGSFSAASLRDWSIRSVKAIDNVSCSIPSRSFEGSTEPRSSFAKLRFPASMVRIPRCDEAKTSAEFRASDHGYHRPSEPFPGTRRSASRLRYDCQDRLRQLTASWRRRLVIRFTCSVRFADAVLALRPASCRAQVCDNGIERLARRSL